MVRAQLGPRSRREAKRLALHLVSLCQVICSAAAGLGRNMDTSLPDAEQELVRHVVEACQNAIGLAVAQPSHAIGLAQALQSALTSLQVVQNEVAKGDAGASAVTSNADALARTALKGVLGFASLPGEALAAMAAVERVAPNTADRRNDPPPAAKPKTRTGGSLPLFSEISQKYINMRIGRDGADHADIQILTLRRQTFIDVMGDRTPDEYYPSDLQDYVNQMQFWPAHVTKRADMAGKSTLEILEANKNFTLMPMAGKTMRDGVANIRTMMAHGMQDHHYRNPFAGALISYPKTLRPSKPRESISLEVTNRVFRNGAASGLLDEAVLPLLAKLTSRRLGLLVYLRGSDIRQKDNIWIAQTDGIVEESDPETGKTRWRRVPVKTDESMTFFLHNYLDQIGLIAWMRAQDGYAFAAAHEHPDPAKYMSKTMQNFFKRNGAKGGEVFHSLRGDAIDGMRLADIQNRTRRLQAGARTRGYARKIWLPRALSRGLSAPCQSAAAGGRRLIGVRRPRL